MVRRNRNDGHSVIEVAPASAETWPDIARIFESHGPLGCWCQYWRKSSSEYSKSGPGSGETGLREQVETDASPPGLIAYLDGDRPAGSGSGRGIASNDWFAPGRSRRSTTLRFGQSSAS